VEHSLVKSFVCAVDGGKFLLTAICLE